MLFAFDGMKGATMSNLRMRNPPNVSSPFFVFFFQNIAN